MKKIKISLIILICFVSFLTCETDPLTGKTKFKIISDTELNKLCLEQYTDFLNDPENKVISVNDPDPTKAAQAQMVARLGLNIRTAAEKWYASIGESSYLKDYDWKYNLVENDQVNAWCMPGGRIVVYTGILPVTETEDALAVVMGHEVSHALLDHGSQRLSASYLQQFGAMAVGLTAQAFGADQSLLQLFDLAYGLTTGVGALKFSRENETEADHYGLVLMAIAGYDPEASVPFWEKMASLSKNNSKIDEFFSTHPLSTERAKALRELIPEAKRKAARLHLDNVKDSIPRAKEVAAKINGQ